MSACVTAFLPDRPAVLRWLEPGRTIRVGRTRDCELCLDHGSVSRLHAELRTRDDRWHLSDRGSKNGSFLDGRAVREAELPERCWLRFGDVMCDFRRVDADERERAEARLGERRQLSQTLGERVAVQAQLPDVLQETLRAVMQLAELERGFLLLRDGDGWRAGAAHGIDAVGVRAAGFAGSAGAVQRAIETRSAVVLNDVGLDPALARRESIQAAGLRSLLVLPLGNAQEPPALVYADSRRPGAAISEIDLELLQAFAERAALWIEARRGADALDRLAAARPHWRDALAAEPAARA